MIKGFCVSILLSLLVEEIFLQVDAACNEDECRKGDTHYCISDLFGKPNNHSHPDIGTCEDIGCAEGGQYCACDKYDGKCKCHSRTPPCNPKNCANDYAHQCCHCWIGGSDKPKKYQLPETKDCGDILKTLGHDKGNSYCGMSVCSCNKFSRCVCEPPKPRLAKNAFRGFTPKTSKCSPENCNAYSYEYCQCNCMPGKSCQYKHIELANQTSSICDGKMKSPYACINAGRKCNCLPDGACNCVDVDPLCPINVDCGKCPSYSNKACVCYSKGLRILIPFNGKSCSSLVSKKAGETPLDSCPYQIGYDCKCEYNTYKKKDQCYCRKVNPFQQIETIEDRPNPKKQCASDDQCKEFNDINCCCSNSIDRTFVRPHTLLNSEDVETVCKGQPPNIACRPYGYKAECKGGRCCYRPIKLYNEDKDVFKADQIDDDDEHYDLLI